MSQNAWRILRARGTNNVPLRRRGASSFSDLLAAHIQWLKTRTKEEVLEHERLLKDVSDKNHYNLTKTIIQRRFD